MAVVKCAFCDCELGEHDGFITSSDEYVCEECFRLACRAGMSGIPFFGGTVSDGTRKLDVHQVSRITGIKTV